MFCKLYGNCSLCLYFNGHFPGGPELADTRVTILDFIGAKDDGDGGENWSYKMCKAPIKSPSTKQQAAFCSPDAFVTQSRVSEKLSMNRIFAKITCRVI